ncbi:MAG TPA: hypothetical protein VFH78_04005 [Candidatus Thermoplasmatota archaeon]|nr:hypothetical protein [Candidatus Thermoplasmatota archaeon]
MRAQSAIAVAVLIAFAGLTGCIGAGKEQDPADSLDPAGTGGTGGTGGVGAGSIVVLQPLASTITAEAAAWVVSGTEVPVSLATPANAKGTLNYTWALGPLPGTVAVTEVKADTGSKGSDYIQPGQTKSITYSASGIYRMHCHPHPWMLHNVTVVDGFTGPKTVDVQIIDGAVQGEYRFVPENIVVGVGTVVNYKNVGAQPHTSTAMGAQEPPLKKLPLSAASGSVVVEGEGWQRIVAIFTDAEGRFGMTEKHIYVTSELPTFPPQTHEFEFQYGASALAATPAAANGDSVSVALAQPGLVFLNYTFQDGAAAAGVPENLAEVELHFTLAGETQDTLTGEGSSGALTGKAKAGTYTLKVIPTQGVLITGTVTVEVVYDLVPPAPNAPAAADDGHGGHAH